MLTTCLQIVEEYNASLMTTLKTDFSVKKFNFIIINLSILLGQLKNDNSLFVFQLLFLFFNFEKFIFKFAFQYLKLKTLKNTEDAKELLTKAKKTKAEKSQKYDKLFTIKLTNLPFKARKRDVKAFLKPFKVDSIRVPQKIHGIAFVGFKSEETFKKVLKAKNKSFLSK